LLSLRKTISFLALSVALAVTAAPSPSQERADRFLALANAGYFKPLQSWLEAQNKGRQIGWD